MRNGYSLYFASFNRNKRSLTLDLRSAEGKAILRKLIATADVVLDNFRPGVMEAMGLSRSELRRSSPTSSPVTSPGSGSTALTAIGPRSISSRRR
jgi:crotonobetainyl-CoA:carnitine CoA-transferase CaiB-like acyl-CoA transferase